MGEIGRAKWKKSYAVPYTDQPPQIITIATSDGKRTITEHGARGPAGLWGLQTTIDGIWANAFGWRNFW